MRTSEITQEDKNTIINCYNSYYTAEHTLNIVPVNIMQYYRIINEAREKGLITIPKHSPKPKPPKQKKPKKESPYDVRWVRDYTKENLEYVKEYYHSQTIKEMAARLNVSQSMIKYYTSILVQKGELQKRSKPKKTDFKDIEIAMIRQRYYRGDSIEEIAKELGVHQSTLRRYLANNGYNRSVKQIKHDRILYLYRLGYKYKEIAEKLDCTVPYVSKQVGKDADRNRKRQKEAEND